VVQAVSTDQRLEFRSGIDFKRAALAACSAAFTNFLRITHQPEVGQSTVKLTGDALNGGDGVSREPRSPFEKIADPCREVLPSSPKRALVRGGWDGPGSQYLNAYFNAGTGKAALREGPCACNVRASVDDAPAQESRCPQRHARS
jgi:hypothetical protein